MEKVQPQYFPNAVYISATHLQLLLSLQGELFERLDDDACVGAVVDEDGGAAHPRLEVVHRQRDVLGVVLQDRQTGWGVIKHVGRQN